MNSSNNRNDKGKKTIIKSIRDVVVIGALACVMYFVMDEKLILEKMLQTFVTSGCNISAFA